MTAPTQIYKALEMNESGDLFKICKYSNKPNKRVSNDSRTNPIP